MSDSFLELRWIQRPGGLWHAQCRVCGNGWDDQEHPTPKSCDNADSAHRRPWVERRQLIDSLKRIRAEVLIHRNHKGDQADENAQGLLIMIDNSLRSAK